MEDVENIQDFIHKENNSYEIDELKQVYQNVDISQEVVVAKTDDIKHIFYRDKETRKLSLDRELLPYEKIVHAVTQHDYYSFDLCNLIFYDSIINRYGNGIVIPRLKKFVMVNDSNLIRKPNATSFYTTGIDEDGYKCASIVDKMGNLYRIRSSEGKSDDFNIHSIYKYNYKRFLMYDYYGFLVEYKGRPVFANISEPPYMILEKERLMELCQGVNVGNMQEKSGSYLRTFDDDFMQGKGYTKRMNKK